MKKIVMIIFTLAMGIGLSIGDIPLVKAQETEEFTLEEITVTAQKREENVQNVPISMEVLTGEDIFISGKKDIEAILDQVGGVQMVTADDGYRIAIRGLSDDTTSWHGQPASSPTVALNLDGVYSNRKEVGSVIFDVERVEILYGPQSTMYSSNSPGGVVNVITASPKLDVYEMSGMLELGNYDAIASQAIMNIPLGDTVALRAAVNYNSHEGYMTNKTTDEDSKAARVRALFKPNEKFSFVLSGEVQKSKAFRFGNREVFENQSDVDDPWFTERVAGNPNAQDGYKFYANIDLDVGFGVLTAVPSYFRNDGVGDTVMMMGTTFIEIDRNSRMFKEKGFEIRLASASDSFLKWILGFSLYDANNIMDQRGLDQSYIPIGSKKYGIYDQETKGVYGNVTYPVTDKFSLNLGLRYSNDTVEIFRYQKMKMMVFEHETIIWNNRYSEPDYKIGVEYDLSDNSMVYADYSTSYRAQGLEGAGAYGPGAKIKDPPPETLKAINLGSKNMFFDKKLQFNASGFYYDYKNYSAGSAIYVYTGDFTEPGAPWSAYRQVDPGCATWGAGEMMGMDIISTWLITPKDILNLSANYLKSEWAEMVFKYEYEWEVLDAPRGPPGTFGTMVVGPLEWLELTGKPMTFSPKYTISATYKHIFNFAKGGSIETEANAVHKGEYVMSWDPDEYIYAFQEAHTKFNLSATYIHSDGRWTLGAYVRNLTNYADKRGYMGGMQRNLRVGDPRTFGMVLSLRY